jgi:hypothetical protein
MSAQGRRRRDEARRPRLCLRRPRTSVAGCRGPAGSAQHREADQATGEAGRASRSGDVEAESRDREALPPGGVVMSRGPEALPADTPRPLADRTPRCVSSGTARPASQARQEVSRTACPPLSGTLPRRSRQRHASGKNAAPPGKMPLRIQRRGSSRNDVPQKQTMRRL